MAMVTNEDWSLLLTDINYLYLFYFLHEIKRHSEILGLLNLQSRVFLIPNIKFTTLVLHCYMKSAYVNILQFRFVFVRENFQKLEQSNSIGKLRGKIFYFIAGVFEAVITPVSKCALLDSNPALVCQRRNAIPSFAIVISWGSHSRTTSIIMRAGRSGQSLYLHRRYARNARAWSFARSFHKK